MIIQTWKYSKKKTKCDVYAIFSSHDGYTRQSFILTHLKSVAIDQVMISLMQVYTQKWDHHKVHLWVVKNLNTWSHMDFIKNVCNSGILKMKLNMCLYYTSAFQCFLGINQSKCIQNLSVLTFWLTCIHSCETQWVVSEVLFLHQVSFVLSL